MTSSFTIGSSLSEYKAGNNDVQLLVPGNDVAEPELAVVIPALNEELTIGRFWIGACKALSGRQSKARF
jgi:hypothetical protein